MELKSLIIFLIIGAIAGWLAGNIMKGKGFGLFGNIVVGIIGALIGGFLFGSSIWFYRVLDCGDFRGCDTGVYCWFNKKVIIKKNFNRVALR